jgi:hypothetical protein
MNQKTQFLLRTRTSVLRSCCKRGIHVRLPTSYRFRMTRHPIRLGKSEIR